MYKVLPTNGESLTLNIEINVLKPCIIRFKGVDTQDFKKVYFEFTKGQGLDNSPLPFGRNELKIAIPNSPEKLRLYAESSESDSSFNIVSITGCPLVLSHHYSLTSRDLEYIKLAEHIAENLHLLERSRVYFSSSEQFKIVIFDEVRDRITDKVMTTPARVNRRTGVVEISYNKMLKYSIPMRMLILLHEYGHHAINTSSEIEADAFAAKLYFKLGYSSREAIQALTAILPNTPSQVKRVKALIGELTKYVGN